MSKLVANLTTVGIVFSRDKLAAQIGGAGIEKMFKSLTVSYEDKRTGYTITRKIYYEFSRRINGVLHEFIIFPRGINNIFTRMGYVINVLFAPRYDLRKFSLELSIKLFDSQAVVVDHMINNIYNDAARDSGRASAILDMRAGLGKTMTAAAIIARLRARTLWITKINALALQALSDLQISFGAKKEDVYPPKGAPKQHLWKTPKGNLRIRIYDPKPPKGDKLGDAAEHDITIMLINTAIKQPVEFFEKYDMIVIDEIHEYVGDKFSELFRLSNRWYMLGMSATINDNEKGYDAIYKMHLGRVVTASTIPGYNIDDVQFTSRVKVVHYYGPPESTKNLIHTSTGQMFVNYMYKQFSDDKYRTMLIIGELRRLFSDEKNNIYIFANEIMNLRVLHAAIVDAGIEVEYESGLKMSSNENITETINIEDDSGDDDIDDIDDNDDNDDIDHNAIGRNDDIKDNMPEVLEPINKPIDAELSKISFFVGKTGKSRENVERIRRDSRVILTTYDYLGTGISIDKMNAIIFAEPRKAKMKQIIGRILRRSGDLELKREIIDIVDAKTHLCHQIKKREIAYNMYDMEIKHYRCNYSELKEYFKKK